MKRRLGMEYLLLNLFNQALMLLRGFVVVDAYQQQVSLIVLQRIPIVLVLDLSQCAGCALVPFQFDHHSGLILMQPAGNKAHIRKAFACGQFTHQRVILPREIERQIDGAAQGVFVVVLQN